MLKQSKKPMPIKRPICLLEFFPAQKKNFETRNSRHTHFSFANYARPRGAAGISARGQGRQRNTCRLPVNKPKVQNYRVLHNLEKSVYFPSWFPSRGSSSFLRNFLRIFSRGFSSSRSSNLLREKKRVLIYGS